MNLDPFLNHSLPIFKSLTLADDGDGGGGALGAGGGELVVLAVDGVGADPDVGDGVHDHLGGVVVLGAADLQLQLLLDHVDAGSDLAREVRVVDAVVDDAVRRLLQRPRKCHFSRNHCETCPRMGKTDAASGLAVAQCC